MSDYPVVSVTNNSGFDVEIFDVYNPDPKGNLSAYEYTSLGKISDGQDANIKTIHSANQLIAVYSGDLSLVTNVPAVYYENFPVAVHGISVLDDEPYKWNISSDDITAMQQAFLFVKYSSSNPDSKIAQAFNDALKSKDQKTAVNKYFAFTKSFPKATLSAWTQIVSWQTQFLSAWQGPYYLYNVPTNRQRKTQIGSSNQHYLRQKRRIGHLVCCRRKR